MTKHEVIQHLLRLSSQLEAEGRVIDALTCSRAAAGLMLHPAKGAGREIDAAVRDAERNAFDELIKFDQIISRSYPNGWPQA